MKNTDAPRVANAHKSPPMQGVGSGSSGSPSEKERARQRAKYHANKDRYRDVAKGFDLFWAKRGGRPA
jgi:hypothetical protein